MCYHIVEFRDRVKEITSDFDDIQVDVGSHHIVVTDHPSGDTATLCMSFCPTCGDPLEDYIH